MSTPHMPLWWAQEQLYPFCVIMYIQLSLKNTCLQSINFLLSLSLFLIFFSLLLPHVHATLP
jgi:hypothetical protein